MTARRFIQAALLLVLFPVIGWTNDGLHIKDAWIRMAPPGSPMAGYFNLTNHGSDDIKLVKASSGDFAHTMIHRSFMDGEIMKMEHVDAIELTPGKSTEFKPGGYHLMLMKPGKTLAAHDKVNVNLEFSDGSTMVVEFMVKSLEESMKMDSTDHSGHGSSEDHSKHGTNE